MSDTDQFFQEEGTEPEQPKPEKAGKPAKRQKGIKPPSFAMAVGITVVALILGLAVGFFVGMYIASNSSVLAQNHADAAATATDTADDSATATQSE